MYALKETQRAFRTYQKMAEIGLVLNQRVKIVAPHSSQ